MPNLKAVIITALAFSAVGAGIWLVSQNTVEKRFTAACIEAIKDRLRSPSTFSLLEVKRFRTITPDIDQFMGWESIGEREEYLAFVRRRPATIEAHESRVALFETGKAKMLEAVIEYEAANGYGVPVRGRDHCSYGYFDGPDPLAYIGGSGPMINGDTNFEWSIRRASE